MTEPSLTRRGGAFFDLDRTLIAGSSAFAFGRAAARAGLVSRRRLVADGWANLRFRLRGMADDDAADALRERVMRSLAGWRVEDVLRMTPDMLGSILPRVYPSIMALAWEHRDAGRPAFICTAASQEVAELMATVLRLDGGLGTRSEIVDGRYTGRPAGPFIYRAGKAEAVRALARERDLDLAASYAYSDSASDEPLLRAVGHPVAVNPDAALTRLAREEGWEILRADRLGRRLEMAAAAALSAGAAGAALARQRR